MAEKEAKERPSAAPRPIAFWRSMGVEDTLPVELFTSILRAQQLMMNHVEEVLKPLDLGATRFFALSTILESESGCRLSDLSTTILVHPTTVTMIVDQLAKQGLVKREPHPTDRRSTLAVITPAGRALCREAMLALGRSGFGISNVSRTKMKRAVEILADVRAEFDDVWPSNWRGA